jgi:hypothetical protein
LIGGQIAPTEPSIFIIGLKMKERTKILAEQAGFMMWQDEDWNPGDVIDWASRYDDELQTFSDLLIKEAIAVVQKRYMGDQNREDMEVRRCVEDLRKHFGVE